MRSAISFAGMLLFLLSASGAHAQFGSIMDDVVRRDAVPVASAIKLIAILSETAEPGDDAEAVRDSLNQLGYALPRAELTDPISYGQVSFLIVQLFDLPGGLRSGLVPGPGSSLEELRRRDLLYRSVRASDHIGGPELLELLGRFLTELSEVLAQ
jgi:hypothetical protein